MTDLAAFVAAVLRNPIVSAAVIGTTVSLVLYLVTGMYLRTSARRDKQRLQLLLRQMRRG
jgi:hypothetical protein